jgi:hypothetical protein
MKKPVTRLDDCPSLLVSQSNDTLTNLADPGEPCRPDAMGMGLTRDSLVSVMYSAALNSAKSSVTLLRTDRHGILGQKSPDFQVSL